MLNTRHDIMLFFEKYMYPNYVMIFDEQFIYYIIYLDVSALNGTSILF